MPNKLMAREYKLLLAAEKFRGKPSPEFAQRFLAKKLAPVFGDLKDLRPADRPRLEGRFDTMEERIVCFRDTGKLLLDSRFYALRERVYLEGKTKRERRITLKLRLPDYFIAAESNQPGSLKNADISFEEDIAPLEVPDPNRPDGKSVVVATPPTMRSRFSLSTTQPLNLKTRVETLSDAYEMFPTLKSNLKAAGATGLSSADPLGEGRTIREFVFTGAKVAFPGGVKGKLVLTLWYFKPRVPRVAEISFKYKTEGASMPGATAHAALSLFNGWQSQLGRWVNLEEASKTALALPRRR